MTQATTYYDTGYDDGSSTDPAAIVAGPTYLPRSSLLPLPFLIPVTICGLSYALNGIQFLTDLGFVLLILLCVTCLVRELMAFPFRFGIGGLIAFTGTLVWFCYDYVNHWMGISKSTSEVELWVLAKSAFFHTLFVFMMVLGLQLRKGRWLERTLQLVPEPANANLYFLLVLVTFVIGMIPFTVFTAEPFYVAIYKTIFAGRSGTGAVFTAGRTGNVNYSWGGYVTQLADIGMMGAILAAFYAILVTRSIGQKIVCWSIWAMWMLISFGTGTRGFTVFVGLPVIMLLFLKYNYIAAAAFRRISFRAYAATAVVGMVFFFLVQVQGQFRNTGFSEVTAGEVEMTELKGNEMFTTTLTGMSLIPGEFGYFANRFPGEGLIRAIPETMYWFVIGPIPRALWNEKPIDPVGTWYSDTVQGDTDGAEGTTISGGAVGTWYWKFGPWGVLQCGLLYGWMMGVAERALRSAAGRPMAVLFVLAFTTFLFRAFRDLWWHNLYPVIIAGVVMYVFVRVANTLFGGGSEEQHGFGVGDGQTA
jgi:hypothetical protein